MDSTGIGMNTSGISVSNTVKEDLLKVILMVKKLILNLYQKLFRQQEQCIQQQMIY